MIPNCAFILLPLFCNWIFGSVTRNFVYEDEFLFFLSACSFGRDCKQFQHTGDTLLIREKIHLKNNTGKINQHQWMTATCCKPRKFKWHSHCSVLRALWGLTAQNCQQIPSLYYPLKAANSGDIRCCLKRYSLFCILHLIYWGHSNCWCTYLPRTVRRHLDLQSFLLYPGSGQGWTVEVSPIAQDHREQMLCLE